jgi:3-dehydroquinate dehydratase-2
LQIVVLQGPNLNRLGHRKPEIYGTRTLADVQAEMDEKAGELGCNLIHFQSNSEGALIDRLQELQDESDAIICNPAGLTNYGLSLRDALAETERDLAITHRSRISRTFTPARNGVVTMSSPRWPTSTWQGWDGASTCSPSMLCANGTSEGMPPRDRRLGKSRQRKLVRQGR